MTESHSCSDMLNDIEGRETPALLTDMPRSGEMSIRKRAPREAAVELRYLGRSGLRVSALTLGAMSFGSMGNADRDDCVRIVHRALEAGINTVDTADVYSAGASE